MKILIVSEVFYPENFIINDLALVWKDMGYEVEVLTQYPSYPQSYVYKGYTNKGYTIEEWNGVKIHRFRCVEGYRDSKLRKVLNYLCFVLKGSGLAKKIGKGFDAVFVSQTGPLSVACPALKVKRKYNTPVTVWTCDIWPDAVWSYGFPQNGFTRFLLNKFISSIYRRCDAVLVSSEKFKETIRQYTDKEIVYAPNWLSPAEERKSRLRLLRNKINFTFTGNVSLYQNLLNTVKGFVQAAIPDAVLNIIGDGSALREVGEYLKNNGIKTVKLYGRYPYSEIADILLQSDILVLPLIANPGIEKTEPFKLQSYLHAGKPVLGICGGSGKELIEEYKIGITCAPDNVCDIARGFEEIVDFKEKEGDSLSLRARELLNTRFSKNSIVKRITDTVKNSTVDKKSGCNKTVGKVS